MKELEQLNTSIEYAINQEKEVKQTLINKIVPHNGHTIFEINNETLEIAKAKFSNATYHYLVEMKKEIIVKKGFTYISALNQKTAMEKFKKGLTGSKEIIENPFTFIDF